MIKMNPSFCQNFSKFKVYSIILLFSCIIFFNVSYAEERQLYVGDLIEIEISSTNLNKDTLSNKFLENDFEIVNIIENENNFILTLRTFETGEKKINIGNNELIINVQSTLNDIKQETPFEGNLFYKYGIFYFSLNYFLIAIICTTVIIIIFNLWVYRRNKSPSKKDPYSVFLTKVNNLSKDDKNYFVHLTEHFKIYIESKFSCRIKGKTSSEIIKEIDTIAKLQHKMSQIKKWLIFCDNLKFKNLMAKLEEKQDLHQSLTSLVKNIEEDMR